MKLPELKFADKVARVPIVQGGMAIRLSTARLAAAVANQGGVGLIAASGMTDNELRYEIRMARSLSPNGIIGINMMVAGRVFAQRVRAAMEEKVDLVVAGAGFSRDVFIMGKEYNVPVAPVVSSAKLAKIAQRLGAAMVIVEGKEAGGHLGTDRSSREIVPEVLEAVTIPVIAAGGVMNGQDIAEFIKMGASGVQMGSRFVVSAESNAAPMLKEFYTKATLDDIVVIHSPVGFPGRAIMNPWAKRVIEGPVPPTECDSCLKACTHSFCIIRSLIRSQQGDVESGLVFSGEFLPSINEVFTVEEIFSQLLLEAEGA